MYLRGIKALRITREQLLDMLLYAWQSKGKRVLGDLLQVILQLDTGNPQHAKQTAEQVCMPETCFAGPTALHMHMWVADLTVFGRLVG